MAAADPIPNTATPPELLCAVVIGRNEGARLTNCLASIASMNEVPGLNCAATIYVDSASTDGSADRARESGALVIPLSAGRMTAARGRNAGWRAAKSAHNPAYILFLDGDTVLHPDFVRKAKETLDQNPAVAAAFGFRRESDPGQSIYTRVLDLDWMIPPGETEFFGGDVLMRTAALDATGGFDDELIAGEEPDLCRRLRALGWRILRIPAPMTSHDLAIYRFGQYWRRLLRAGYAFAQVSQRFKSTGDPFWSGEARRNRFRGIFWAAGFLAAILASLLLALLARPFASVSGSLPVWLLSPLPLVAWFALLAVMAARSAWKFRWKSSSFLTLALYGLHSHLQQIPVALGQFAWWRDQRNSHQRELLEYKDLNRP